MTTLTLERDPVISRVAVHDSRLHVYLEDGRTLSLPLEWYPRLLHATQAERDHYIIDSRGYGIHWPELDEDLHVIGLIAGRPSYESEKSLKRWLEARASAP